MLIRLVPRFKQSAEFDRLRRELLQEFRNGVRVFAYHACVPLNGDFRRMVWRLSWPASRTLYARSCTMIASCSLGRKQRPSANWHKSWTGKPVPRLVRTVSMLTHCRYPVVERAVSDIPSLADADFSSRLRESLSRVLQKSRSGDMAASA